MINFNQKYIKNDQFQSIFIENRSLLYRIRYRRFDQIVAIRIDDNSTIEFGFQIRFDDVDSIRESESHQLTGNRGLRMMQKYCLSSHLLHLLLLQNPQFCAPCLCCPWGTCPRCKLMRLGSPNRIDVVESNLKSEFDRRIIVDSDSNGLIESTRSIFDINRSIID